MSHLGNALKTQELFNSIEGSPREAPRATPAATSDRADPHDETGSSDDEVADIPSVAPITPSRSQTSTAHSGRAMIDYTRPRTTEPPAKKARLERHPMMDDIENELFISPNLDHLNSALAMPPKAMLVPAGLVPFPFNSSQRQGVRKRISQPFITSHPETNNHETEPERLVESGVELPAEPTVDATPVSWKSRKEGTPNQREETHTNGVATIEESPGETVTDATQRTHITVQAEAEGSFEQTTQERENHSVTNASEKDQSAQSPRQKGDEKQALEQSVESQPTAGPSTSLSVALPSWPRSHAKPAPPSGAQQQLPQPAIHSATPITPKKRKRTHAQATKPAFGSEAYPAASTAPGQGSPVLGSAPEAENPALPNGPAPTTPLDGSRQEQNGIDSVRNDPEALTYPDVSLVLSYNARHFSSVTTPVLSDHLVDMTVLLGSEDWTNGGATWGSELFEEPTSVLAPYRSDVCERLGRYLLFVAEICRDIPGNPGTQAQFKYFSNANNQNRTLIPKYIASIDNQVSEIVQKKLGRQSNTPAKSRCRVAMDLRRNVIPVAVLVLELVFLAGRPAGDAGLLDVTPEQADHTKQTLQLLRRILSWIDKLESAMTEEFAGAMNRRKTVGSDIPPGMFERQGLNTLIEEFKETLDEAYRAIAKKMSLVKAPTAKHRRHLERLALEETQKEERLQDEQLREERRWAKQHRAERRLAEQRAEEDARRRFMDSVQNFTESSRRDDGELAHRAVADLPAQDDRTNGHHDHRESRGAKHPTGTAGGAYPDEVFKKVLRALKYSQKPNVESIAETLQYHVEDVWEVVGLLKSAAEAQQRADGQTMPAGLRRSFAYLYR
ncbi:hypothetical protein ACHAQA_003081 [Verticillium albo-atrum]